MEDTPAIIISGGSRGLGLALVRDFLTRDYRVASFSRRRSEEIKQLEQEHSDNLFFEEVDATSSQVLVDFVDCVHKHFNRIDALVNNAGVAFDGVLALTTDQSIDQMLNVNLKAALILARETSRLMLDQRSGSIVNISSIIANQGFSGLSVYAATKAGMIGMTRSLARELGPRNIRVNAVAPGYLETDMSSDLGPRQRQQITRRTPLGRLGTVDDVTPMVKFLTSPESAFITGQVFVVDGGSSV